VLKVLGAFTIYTFDCEIIRIRSRCKLPIRDCVARVEMNTMLVHVAKRAEISRFSVVKGINNQPTSTNKKIQN